MAIGARHICGEISGIFSGADAGGCGVDDHGVSEKKARWQTIRESPSDELFAPGAEDRSKRFDQST